MTYEAFKEGMRVKELSAFNIFNATRRKINQHKSVYKFKDGSNLEVFSTNSRAISRHPNDNTQNASFILKINKQGN